MPAVVSHLMGQNALEHGFGIVPVGDDDEGFPKPQQHGRGDRFAAIEGGTGLVRHLGIDGAVGPGRRLQCGAQLPAEAEIAAAVPEGAACEADEPEAEPEACRAEHLPQVDERPGRGGFLSGREKGFTLRLSCGKGDGLRTLHDDAAGMGAVGGIKAGGRILFRLPDGGGDRSRRRVRPAPVRHQPGQRQHKAQQHQQPGPGVEGAGQPLPQQMAQQDQQQAHQRSGEGQAQQQA